jgi:hypothetical protein
VPFGTPCNQQKAAENEGDGERNRDRPHDFEKYQEVFARAVSAGRSVRPMRPRGCLYHQQGRQEDRHPHQPNRRHQPVKARGKAEPGDD